MGRFLDEFSRLRRGVARRLRRYLYSMRCKRFGRGVEIADEVLMFNPRFIEIGDGAVINERVILQSCEGADIVVGEGVVISYGAYILTGGLEMAEGRPRQNHATAPVTIGPRAWIGAGALLLPGVSIGPGAVVGAGSVVTRDVPEGVKVVGSPARPVP